MQVRLRFQQPVRIAGAVLCADDSRICHASVPASSSWCWPGYSCCSVILQAYVHVTSNKIRVRGAFFVRRRLVLAIMWVIYIVEVLTVAAPTLKDITMPLDYCHPTAPHKKLRLPEWYVSSLMMDRALDAICRRVKKSRPQARYSLPRRLQPRRQDHLYRPPHAADVQIPRPHHRYRPLSHPARRGREDADRPARPALSARPSDRDPRRGGGRPGRRHRHGAITTVSCRNTSRQIGDERLTKVPKDLDLKPYRDEQDDDLLRRMLKSVRAGKAPKGIHVRDLAEAIQELRRHVRRHDTPAGRRLAAMKRLAKAK